VLEENKGATIRALSFDEVSEYLEVRGALEGIISRYAAKNISEENAAQLELILNDMRKTRTGKQYEQYIALNQRFHNIIYEAANRRMMTEIILGIKLQLARLQYRTLFIPGRTEQSIQEHKDIIEAMRNHDEDKAEEAARRHIHRLMEVFKTYQGFLF
jgi:DNA-binding GntR family transcriptional regulator